MLPDRQAASGTALAPPERAKSLYSHSPKATMKREIPIDGTPDREAAPQDAGAGADAVPAGATGSAGGRGTAAADETYVEGSPDDVEERLAALHDEIAALNDQHLRLAAEFQNYRKRVTREREEMRARSQAELVGVLLDALDDLERVTNVDAESASTASLIEGVDLVERKLQRALEAAGAETIDAAGKRFDPETMEAIGALPTDDPDQDETVAMTVQRGYRMHGILVRPARVQVLKHGG
jgi:molecular chaperone GrpE